MQKTKINNKGRPKTDWDSQSYDDINLKNLDTAKRKRFENIKSLNNKIFNIDKLIEKNQKLILRYLKSKKPILDQISLNNDELNKITRAINQKTKIFSKNNESITITRQKNYIRGKISYFGKALWCHIGSINKYGLVHKKKKIGKMSNSELCDEFRNKAKIKIESSWIVETSYK